jgi:hypothetical protein
MRGLFRDNTTVRGRSARRLRLVSSFRDGPKDQTRNLQIPRCAIAHLRFARSPSSGRALRGPVGPPRNDASRHIGGVSPLRPTLMRLASNEPSGCFLMKAITLAPALSSDLSAGT